MDRVDALSDARYAGRISVYRNTDASRQPLEGTRVLDFSHVLSGPYCSLLLLDLGADVVKVERPGRGDATRHWGPSFLGDEEPISTYFASLNRGKRSVAVDLRTDSGRRLIHELVQSADIVIENFRPGVATRLGLDHETLATFNPRIVSCSISGYGAATPYATLPGTEIVVEAMSGLMDLTGPVDGDPVRMGVAMVDILTGLTAATRVVASLLDARETGQGCHIECSLYASALASMGTLITDYTATGQEPRRRGLHHPSVSPYGGFRASDGYVITGVIDDASWPGFCDALELSSVAERERFSTNAKRLVHRQELERLISEQALGKPVDHWLARLRERGLLAAPIRRLSEALEDQATGALRMFVEIAGHTGVLSPRLDGGPAVEASQSVPRLGEHTAELIAELSSGDSSISRDGRRMPAPTRAEE